uniref:Uncharacterized protein n=1 Tax=Arundo donax TaxID=35708 RepID=A0A0A9F3V5_ARUDO
MAVGVGVGVEGSDAGAGS